MYDTWLREWGYEIKFDLFIYYKIICMSQSLRNGALNKIKLPYLLYHLYGTRPQKLRTKN